jgi:hypothetical protein
VKIVYHSKKVKISIIASFYNIKIALIRGFYTLLLIVPSAGRPGEIGNRCEEIGFGRPNGNPSIAGSGTNANPKMYLVGELKCAKEHLKKLQNPKIKDDCENTDYVSLATEFGRLRSILDGIGRWNFTGISLEF